MFLWSLDRSKNHFGIILEVKSTKTHEQSITVNVEFKDGRQKRMTETTFVWFNHDDSHVKIHVLWLVQFSWSVEERLEKKERKTGNEVFVRVAFWKSGLSVCLSTQFWWAFER